MEHGSSFTVGGDRESSVSRGTNRISNSVSRGVGRGMRRGRVRLERDGTALLLENVTLEDAAEYRCRVHYRLSPTWTQRLLLTVHGQCGTLGRVWECLCSTSLPYSGVCNMRLNNVSHVCTCCCIQVVKHILSLNHFD